MRRSCGCVSEAILRVNEGLQGIKPGSVEASGPEHSLAGPLLKAARDVLLGEVQRAMVFRDMPQFSEHAGQWLEALIASLDEGDNGEHFLTAIGLTSRRMMDMRIPVANLQDVLSALQRECYRTLADHPALLAQAENLWHRARVFLNELVLQQQIRRRVEMDKGSRAFTRCPDNSSALHSTY